MTLNNKTTALMLSIALGAFISCSDDESSPATNNNNTGGGGGGAANVNDYKGSASYGDIVELEIDQIGSKYTANNLTTGRTESNNYVELDASIIIDSIEYDVFEGLYEIDEGGNGKSYGIEIEDRIIAGNFPIARANNDIVFGVTDEVSLFGQESQIIGTYFFIKISPALQASGEIEWGQFTIDDEGDIWLFSETDEYVEDETYNLPVDSIAVVNHPNGEYYYTEITEDGRALEFYDEQDSLLEDVVGYTYLDGESTAMMIDLGEGEGTIYAFKTDLSQLSPNGSEDFNSYIGTYKYVDFYEGFDVEKGAGNITINANRTWDYSFIAYDPDPSVDDYVARVDTQVPLDWTGVPGVYYRDNWDGTADGNIYFVFAGDFFMYFDYNDNDEFRGYGIGGELN